MTAPNESFTPVDKFLEWVPEDLREDECWEWTGRTNFTGYGALTIKANGRKVDVLAHRVSALILGQMDIRDVLVRHKCDNPPCVNPGHLLTGSHFDNSQDMLERGRDPKVNVTHCKHGHEFTQENTYTLRGRRSCRACSREKTRRYRRKKALDPESVLPLPEERTECINGHPFDAENTYISRRGERACRECHNQRAREAGARRRAKAKEEK